MNSANVRERRPNVSKELHAKIQNHLQLIYRTDYVDATIRMISSLSFMILIMKDGHVETLMIYIVLRCRVQNLLMGGNRGGNKVTLRKHAHSNILKILQPKTENFQIKNSDIFHISAHSID